MSEDSQAAGTPGEQPMPQVSLGPHKISRLILGGNPTSGGVHMPRMFNYQIKRYYTPERVVQTLSDCEKNGINVWQTCPTRGFPTNLAMYQRHRAQGGKLHYMSIAADMPASRGPVPDNFSIAAIAEAGAIAIAHWGSFTDRAWRAGKMDQVRDYLKRVRDAGLVVGVSTHRPDVVDYVESEGWDVDYYMACVYQCERTREEVQALLGGHVPAPGTGREVYLESDPPLMFKRIQQTSKTCLAFKILASGRISRQEHVEQAFKETFSQIKAGDAVIVGMYPEHQDELQINADYVRKYSHLSKEY